MKNATIAAQRASIPAAIAAQAVIAAAMQFLARRDRAEHPDGKFDNAQRWYPGSGERQNCCSHIRSPSRAHPYSNMTHCRTAEHIASMHGVDVTEVRRMARELENDFEIDEDDLITQ